ncbi:MAG: response regulator [Lunatimonas sp.]|uniref:response regulator n=1 Tax=Lunatimonas sp. TaxID=2060141 RepID=UPI00263A9B0D|nr:response regulator [Lunatimonas sp.]MCC5935916.1 response regulator [Lunatimonas sp.]
MNDFGHSQGGKRTLKGSRNYYLGRGVKNASLDRLLKIGLKSMDCSYGYIAFFEKSEIWFKSCAGVEAGEIHLGGHFKEFHRGLQELRILENIHEEADVPAGDFLIQGDIPGFWAGVPIIQEEGEVLGVFAIADHSQKKTSAAQLETMKLLSEQVFDVIIEKNRIFDEKLMSKALELSQDLICVIRFDGKFSRVNQAFKNLLGYSETELFEKSLEDLVHPEDVSLTENQIRSLISGNPALHFSHRLKTKGGDYKIFSWTGASDTVNKWIFAIGRDITAEREKEEKLKLSENKFRSFFENSQGLMLTHDLNGKFLSINNLGARLLGYTVEELLNKTLWDIIPSKYHPEIDRYFEEIHEQGIAKGLMTTRLANGTYKVWLYSNTLEEDILGTNYVIGNSIDVTERLRLERSIQNAKELLTQTHMMARVGGWKYDLTKGDLNWTEITKNIHGVDEGYIPELEKAMLFFKEGRDRDRMQEIIELAKSHGKPWDERLKLITADGKEIWVRIIGEANVEEGEINYLYGTIQDIDDQVKSVEIIQQKEQMLQAISTATDELLSNANLYEAIANSLEIIGKAVNVDRTYFFENGLNEEGQQITSQRFEWSSTDAPPMINNPELQNVPIAFFSDFFEPMQEGLSFSAIISDLPENNGTRQLLESQLIRSVLTIPIFNGEEFWGFIGYDECKFDRTWSDAELSLLKSFANSIGNAIARKNLEERLRNSKELAEKASVAKSEFLANMSHEIRTPLNGIIGFTDLLSKSDMSDSQMQYVNIVNQSANTLLNIINDILDFSKIEAGKLELDVSKADIYDLAGQATDVISFQAQNKGVEMLLNLSLDLPRYIFVDEIRLKQILINLLGNAVKFTEQGEIELKIYKVGQTGPRKFILRFEVRDTGIGISKDKQLKIFDAFSQEDNSTTKKYGGTGLGLTISNKLLKMMGTELNLHSEMGKGSTFFFDLHLDTEAGHKIDWEDLSFLENALVVDDNVNNRLIVKELLTSKNIQVTEAQNGYEALEKLEAFPEFDVVLMDYNMPYMDGLETIKKIRESFPEPVSELPILLLHSSADDEFIHDACKKLHVSGKLAKPIKLADLVKTLGKINPKNRVNTNVQLVEGDLTMVRTFKVLIAEDNTINMFLAKTIVKKISPNAEIIEAKNGREAVELAIEVLPDIILMDIQMPEMSGHEATQEIRTHAGLLHIPIVAVTAGNVKGEREHCLDIGMVDFIPKPIVEASIRGVFEKWLPEEAGLGKTSSNAESPSENPASAGSKNHFNIEKLQEYMGDNPTLIREVLRLTLQEIQLSQQKLTQAISRKDVIQVRSEGHKLKGSALTAGLDEMLSISLKFEGMEESLSGADEVLSAFAREEKIVRKLIEEFLMEKE